MSALPLGVPKVWREPRSDDELRAIVERGQHELGPHPTTDETIDWAARTFPDMLAVASAMADAVLPHVVSQRIPGVDVLFVDTGYHFSDTLVTRDIVAETMPVRVVSVQPAQSVAEQDAQYGERLFERNPSLCCELRKVRPLKAAMRHYEAWMTGLRWADSPERAQTPVLSWDAKQQRVKICPIVAWTDEQVDAYIREHDVEINLLLTDGYPSIGCEPCTRRVEPGQDPRSGRWVGWDKSECGLHI